jgi:hypothetical protein
MFCSTEASKSQWESSVFVSPIKAPALIILDEYGAEEFTPFSFRSVSRATMVDPRNAVTLQDFSLALLLISTHFRASPVIAILNHCPYWLEWDFEAFPL